MERITHNLVQGSAEWLLYRAQHDNASDAAAMLNCSPYKTRNELLHERWLGMQPEFAQYVQERVLDRGHSFERLARPLAEAILDEELFPVTMSLGAMSASLDGHTFDGRRNWEHKSLNDQLLAVMPNEFNPGSDLPKFYRVQMEHQFIPSGAEETLFTASKWNGEDLLDIRHAWYFPDFSLRAEIVAGWEQFHKDLAVYQPPESEKPKPAGKRLDQLPALHVTVEGRLTESNLGVWKEHALSVIGSVNRSLVTDEDFATAENMVKWCGTVESACDSATAYIRSQVGTIDQALKAVEDVKAASAKVRVELKNLGDRRKKERKDELVADAVASFHKHTADLNEGLAPYRLPMIVVDFAGQIKGKSKFSNMKNDLDAELARGKIEANAVAEKMRANIAAINAKPEFLGLFADAATLIQQPADHLALVLRTRISDHEAELTRKAEEAAHAAEEKIRADERARVQAEADAKARVELAAEEQRKRDEKAQADRIAENEAQEARLHENRKREEAEYEQRRQDAEALRERQQAEEDLKKLGQAGSPVAAEPTPAERRAESVASVGAEAFERSPHPIYSDEVRADPANLNLGAIADRLGFRLDLAFITETLGVPFRRQDKAARFWTERDYLLICEKLATHIEKTCVPF